MQRRMKRNMKRKMKRQVTFGTAKQWICAALVGKSASKKMRPKHGGASRGKESKRELALARANGQTV